MSQLAAVEQTEDEGRKSVEDWLAAADAVGRAVGEGAAERDANDEFIGTHYDLMREQGLISALVPAELGGGGASYSTIAAILRRLAYYDGSTALALAMHQHLLAAQVFNHMNGRPAPVLGRVAKEQIVLVSTGANDWLESNGEAKAVEGGFRVTAKKSFASGSPAGAVAVTSARYEDPEAGASVLHFPVPLSSPGIRLDDDWYVHGMRATGSQSIVMDDVFVPEAAIALKRPRAGFAPIFNVVAGVAMPLISAAYVGVADRAAELGTQLATRRAEQPDVQWAAGEMTSARTVAETCLERLVSMANELSFTPSLEHTNRVFQLKSATMEQARKTVEAAMEAAGGAGFYRKAGLERLLRDVRAGNYHPLPAKQQVMFSGKMALGLDPA